MKQIKATLEVDSLTLTQESNLKALKRILDTSTISSHLVSKSIIIIVAIIISFIVIGCYFLLYNYLSQESMFILAILPLESLCLF